MELERRNNLPVFKYQPDSAPDRNQLAFHQSQARYCLAFGGNRGGKSVVTAYETVAWSRNISRFAPIPPGPKVIYCISSEYRTLFMGIHRHLMPDRDGMRFLDPTWVKNMGPKIPGSAVPLPSYIDIWSNFDYDGTIIKSTAKDRPHSTIWFISGEGGESARRKVQATPLDLCVIDEEVDETLWAELQMRLLDRDGRVKISATLIRSEDWLVKLEERAEEGDEEVSLVRLNTETNEHLSSRARKEILSKLSPEERAIRVEGKSRRKFGLVYSSFGAEHVFDHDINPTQDGLLLIRANDPGFKVHAILWAALELSTKSLYIYREMYGIENTLLETCTDIAAYEGFRLEPQHGVYKRVPVREKPEIIGVSLVDPAGLQTLQDGRMSVAIQMASTYDTMVMPANNDVQYGVEAVRRLMTVNPMTGKPYLQVSKNLPEFHRERKRYKLRQDTNTRNAHATKIEPLRRHNHLMDGLRYIAAHVITLIDEPPKEIRKRYHVNTTLSMSDRIERSMQRFRNKKEVHPTLGSYS